MITVYGIRQCDTCRKALKWLESQALAHAFHDVRADGLEAARVNGWMASAFADTLVNRRSTTWRTLTDQQKAAEGPDLAALLIEHPTLIKRPVFERDGEVVAVGFKPAELVEAL